MILYNVTIKINKVLEEEWLQWMRTVHIPKVMSTGLFVDHKVCKLLHDDEDGGVSYALQYFCKDLPDFQKYQSKHAKVLQEEHSDRYKNQYIAFRTLMEVIE